MILIQGTTADPTTFPLPVTRNTIWLWHAAKSISPSLSLGLVIPNCIQYGSGVESNRHSEEEFRAQIKETIAKQFEADSDYKFLLDVRTYLSEKVGKLQFADELMKRIMLENNKEKGEEFVSENYEKSLEELTWHLIKEKLVAANDIKVEQTDITNMAKEATRAQFAQYGMINVPDELLENYSKEMLKKRESVEALVNRVVESKLSEILKGQVTLNHKAVSAEEFNKMFQ